MKTKILLSLLFAAGVYSSADVHELCRGFVEDNTMWISADDKTAGGITEAQFNAVIDKATNLYTDYFASKGAKLVVERKWTDGTVNAYARQSGSNWIVSMFGGLARHETITQDGFAVVICHEIGHHVGGAPKYKSWGGGSDWASNEGQSDYFASLKCLRKYFADEDNIAALENVEVDPLVLERCNSEHSNPQEVAACARISLAAGSVARLFQSLRNESTPPLYNTPDTRVVSSTSDSHPGTQCRMDTYFGGAVCAADHNVEVSKTDYRVGTCTDLNGLGTRARCWFAPTN